MDTGADGAEATVGNMVDMVAVTLRVSIISHLPIFAQHITGMASIREISLHGETIIIVNFFSGCLWAAALLFTALCFV